MYDKALTGEPGYDASFRWSFRLSASQREALAAKLAWKLRTIYEPSAPVPSVPGIHVLSSSEVAEILGMSRRHLTRLEMMDVVPRRRRISRRRTVFLIHDLEGRSAASVMVRDRRTLGVQQVARKLGVGKRTLWRMVRHRAFPAPTHGRWFERDVDAWLLECPTV